MFISEAFAQAAPAASSGPGGFDPMQLVLFGGMFAVLYFVMIRPQMKRQKEAKAMTDSLAKGDEVVMASGILGKITKLGDNYLSIEIASGVEIQAQRTTVVQVLPKGTVK